MYQIDSFLSARRFFSPQYVDGYLYCISDLNGRLSLYSMEYGGSVPVPLIPPQVALQNPVMMEGGESYAVFPNLKKILLLLDQDGNEIYQPMLIPIDGGYPVPAFKGLNPEDSFLCTLVDAEQNIVYLHSASHQEEMSTAWVGNLKTGKIEAIGSSQYGAYPMAYSHDHRLVILQDGYGPGDTVLYLVDRLAGNKKSLLIGKPLNERKPGEKVIPNGIYAAHFLGDSEEILLASALFDQHFSPNLLDLSHSCEVSPVRVTGTTHFGDGELVNIKHLSGNHFTLEYNINGCSWLYTAKLDRSKKELAVTGLVAGEGELSNGVLQSWQYEKAGHCFTLSFSSATSPTQLYSVEGEDFEHVIRHTNERILGIPQELLAVGEDASFESYDGLHVSARLYLPSPELNLEGKYPLVYYVHGGPNSQERPDFSWFSMPLIQMLTLEGFAVFVPNVRGSTGYGMRYSEMVNRDWGGKDRQDHVYAMTKFLSHDERLDLSRTGVVGRSYGGYMSLTLASRHPELWKAAVDMFGPYDLISFSERLPETWKPFFRITMGDPQDEKDHQFLIERSPSTYLHQLACPLFVIQGKNDPRVTEEDSHKLVDSLREQGKQVNYLVFDDEGHDILKLENRIRCYSEIIRFFQGLLKS